MTINVPKKILLFAFFSLPALPYRNIQAIAEARAAYFHVFLYQAIIHFLLVAAVDDDSRLPQDSEMAAHRRLRQPYGLDYVVDCHLLR